MSSNFFDDVTLFLGIKKPTKAGLLHLNEFTNLQKIQDPKSTLSRWVVASTRGYLQKSVRFPKGINGNVNNDLTTMVTKPEAGADK